MIDKLEPLITMLHGGSFCVHAAAPFTKTYKFARPFHRPYHIIAMLGVYIYKAVTNDQRVD